MNILGVGDIHGKIFSIEAAVKKFKQGRYDRLILMGDYTDSFDKTVMQHIQCLQAIAEYQEELGKDRLIALIGNHDHPAYLHNFWCKGSDKEMMSTYQKYYEQAEYKIAHQEGRYLFTHGGINLSWWNRVANIREFLVKNFEVTNVADLLNKMYNSRYYPQLFQVGKDRGGEHNSGGPVWSSLFDNEVFHWNNLNQVVGHSKVQSITSTQKRGARTFYIDCLDHDPYMFLDLTIRN